MHFVESGVAFRPSPSAWQPNFGISVPTRVCWFTIFSVLPRALYRSRIFSFKLVSVLTSENGTIRLLSKVHLKNKISYMNIQKKNRILAHVMRIPIDIRNKSCLYNKELWNPQSEWVFYSTPAAKRSLAPGSGRKMMCILDNKTKMIWNHFPTKRYTWSEIFTTETGEIG